MKKLLLLLFMAAAVPASSQWFVQMHLNGSRIGQEQPFQRSVVPFGYGLFGGLTVSPKVFFYAGINAAFYGRDKFTASADPRDPFSPLPTLSINIERTIRNISPELRLRFYVFGDKESDFGVFGGVGIAREFIRYKTTAAESFNEDDYLLFINYNNNQINIGSNGGGQVGDIIKVYAKSLTLSAGAEKAAGNNFWLTGAINYYIPYSQSGGYSFGRRAVTGRISLEIGLRGNL
jgi:Outer membrane protein beta-barrel domain